MKNTEKEKTVWPDCDHCDLADTAESWFWAGALFGAFAAFGLLYVLRISLCGA